MENQSINILQINTALQTASVSLSCNGKLLAERINNVQNEHASFVQPAIVDLMNETESNIDQIHAVSVVNGPGSYTGLRVGLASAKGICFAKNIPLICINTLEWMAHCSMDKGSALICSMIDARRDEVFTAIYSDEGKVLLEPTAMVLDKNSFSDWLVNNKIKFVGDGAMKWGKMVDHQNAFFPSIEFNALKLSDISYQFWMNKQFVDLAYAEPFYTKDFYTPQRS